MPGYRGQLHEPVSSRFPFAEGSVWGQFQESFSEFSDLYIFAMRKYEELFDIEEFLDIISNATAKPENVKKRMDYIQRIVEEVVRA